MTDILDRIDDTLTYYSAGLGGEVTVPVEKPADAEIAEAAEQYLRTFVDRLNDMFAHTEQAMLALLPALNDMAEALQPVVTAIDTQRRARLRRMHHLYRQRRR